MQNVMHLDQFMGATKRVKSKNDNCVKIVQIRDYFWSVFSCIQTEYEVLLRKSSYSVQIQESTDKK